MKTRSIFTKELKSGCPLGVFCPSSIPSEYLFLCTRRKFGFNKKIRTKLLIVYVYFQPNSCNTHAEHQWAQGTFLRQWRKVPPAHAQRVWLPSPHRINFSVCSSVCLSVHRLSMKTRRIFTKELKSGCPRGVFCLLSIPSEYLFLCKRRKFGFNKKIRRKSLIVYVYYQPNSCTMYHTPAER